MAASDGKLRGHARPVARADPGDTHPRHPNIRLMHGMVGDATAQAMAGRYDNIVGFVAGPPPMVDGALRLLIRDARVPPQFIRYDKFA